MTDWEGLPLDARHVELLRDQAGITAEVAAARRLRSAHDLPDLPEWARDRPWARDALPALIFPWTAADGRVVEQIRPDTPLVWDTEDEGSPQVHKYLWPSGVGSILNEVVPAGPDTTTVLIVEGTKQALAAASWAPEGVAVYGVGGCRNWSSEGVPLDDLGVAEDRDAVICLDADVATNLDVYTAAVKLGQAVKAEGATSIRYVRLPGAGSVGLDDLLAGRRDLARRTRWLSRLIADADKKPADRRPVARAKAGPEFTAPETVGDRPMIYVDGDRLDVINDITTVLLDRWDRTRLFCHGETMSQLRGVEMKPLTEGSFLDLLQDTAATGSHKVDRDGNLVGVVYGWPDSQSIKAAMSRADRFARLDSIARSPFVRPDGTICLVNGYDEQTRTMVVMDESLAELDVPESPTGEEIAYARKLILDEWLGDFPFPDEESRANALGLVLTPFVRPMLPLAPMAVIDGLAPGSGKNLFVDCVLTMFLGEVPEMLGFDRNDDEMRKILTSAFKAGSEIIIFDEAHHIDGVALARALTAHYWKDRLLGGNVMLGIPNRATWLAMGNNVRVEGDLFRRVYRIALKPDDEHPEDRPASSFRHPDLKEWTERNRPELLRAALTLVRAWFAAGEPWPAEPVAFGSFERWARVLGGILDVAGQPGFLGNLRAWRSESNLAAGYWTAHLRWLLETFGTAPFTTREVRARLVVGGDDAEWPPIRADRTDPQAYAKALGESYHSKRDRAFGGLRLRRLDGTAHGGRARWAVEGRPGESGSEGGPSDPQPDDARFTPELSETIGGTGGTGETPNHYTYDGETYMPRDARDDAITEPVTDTCVAHIEGGAGGLSGPSTVATEASALVTEAVSDESGVADTDNTGVEAATQVENGLFASGPWAKAYERVEVSEIDARGAVTLPEGVLALDVETASEEELWSCGPDFVRLIGYQTGDRVTVSPDPWELAGQIARARLVIGHNVMAYDLVAYALHYGIDLVQMADEGRVFDTKLAGILNSPPTPGMSQGQINREYSLDNMGARLLGATKTGDLKALAKEFGGFDRIPLDHAGYVKYLVGDVDLVARLARELKTSDYIRREHRVAAIAAQMRINGFRVDEAELATRVAANRAERARRLGDLAERYGLPTTKKDGKPSKSPHATAEGKAAIAQAFADLGVTLPPTPNGEPGFGKVALAQVAEDFADREDVLALVELVGGLNGVRTVYETIAQYTINGRVHPEIGMFQASGRWSTTKPGLTVLGKRGGKYQEREVLLPEPGHVIISADLSQVDARALAALSQDPAYIAMFAPGLDLHKEVARRIWGDTTRRDDAKALGHGWNYGMGVNGLMRNAKVDEDTARRFDRGMREQFPRLVEWRDGVRAAGEVGEILDNGFGRPLRVDPSRSYTQAPALMGQGCARDLMMEGLLRLPREVHPMLRAVVHDEVILSVPADAVEDVERVVVDSLSFDWAPPGAERSIRIEAGLGDRRGRNWGEVYAK